MNTETTKTTETHEAIKLSQHRKDVHGGTIWRHRHLFLCRRYHRDGKPTPGWVLRVGHENGPEEGFAATLAEGRRLIAEHKIRIRAEWDYDARWARRMIAHRGDFRRGCLVLVGRAFNSATGGYDSDGYQGIQTCVSVHNSGHGVELGLVHGDRVDELLHGDARIEPEFFMTSERCRVLETTSMYPTRYLSHDRPGAWVMFKTSDDGFVKSAGGSPMPRHHLGACRDYPGEAVVLSMSEPNERFPHLSDGFYIEVRAVHEPNSNPSMIRNEHQIVIDCHWTAPNEERRQQSAFLQPLREVSSGDGETRLWTKLDPRERLIEAMLSADQWMRTLAHPTRRKF